MSSRTKLHANDGRLQNLAASASLEREFWFGAAWNPGIPSAASARFASIVEAAFGTGDAEEKMLARSERGWSRHVPDTESNNSRHRCRKPEMHRCNRCVRACAQRVFNPTTSGGFADIPRESKTHRPTVGASWLRRSTVGGRQPDGLWGCASRFVDSKKAIVGSLYERD